MGGSALIDRITKLRENCLAEFDAHWKCLEMNNQVSEGGQPEVLEGHGRDQAREGQEHKDRLHCGQVGQCRVERDAVDGRNRKRQGPLKRHPAAVPSLNVKPLH